MFKTTNIYLAAAIKMSNDIKLIKVEKSPIHKNKYEFTFDNVRKCEKIKNEYWDKTLQANIYLFVETYQSLKSRAFGD